MLIVQLPTLWFAPNGVRYRPNPNGTEVPDEFENLLPSRAEIVGRRADVEPPKRQRKRTAAERRATAHKPAEGEPTTLSEMGKKAPVGPMEK